MPTSPPELLHARLSAPGSKRILSLDGGGIRGLITLGYLGRLEALLKERRGDPDFVLSDYFDLIGGTSTGALIAACLALGWPVSKVAGLYQGLARDVFRPKPSLLGPLARLVGAKFDERPLEQAIRAEIGDMRLDDERFRSGLVVVAKRADTASVWQLTNVPGHRFYEMNRHLRVWEVLRASSAAPTYFKPQRMGDVGGGESAVFVDGGVSMHSNPALQMLMVANLDGFGLRWPLGEDRILLCSLGTGAFDLAPDKESIRGYRQIQWLGILMVQLLRDASDLGETLLQWMSRSPTARSIDLQIGDLRDDRLTPEALLTYLRYDVPLTLDGLEEIGEGVSARELQALRSLDGTDNVEKLDRIGRAAAAAQMQPHHLPAAFDRTGPGRSAASANPGLNPGARTVGVTGHRAEAMAGAELRLLEERLDAVLEALAAAGYGVLISGLAEGADRLVAGRALAGGWTLCAFLPLSAERYEEDFPDRESRTAFRRFLARATAVEVVNEDTPERPASRSRAYAGLGAALVARSALLLAVWDGEEPRGPGGTGDVVARALAAGTPVVWIEARPPHRVRVGTGGRFGEALEDPVVEGALAASLREAPTPAGP